MKIVIIHGQNHKGNTWNVANVLLQNITGDKEVKEFFLPKDLNHFCIGCYSCIEGSRPSDTDDTELLYDAECAHEGISGFVFYQLVIP